MEGEHVSFEKSLQVIPKCSHSLSRTLTQNLEPGKKMVAGEWGAGNHIRKRNGGGGDNQRDHESCLQIFLDSQGDV